MTDAPQARLDQETVPQREAAARLAVGELVFSLALLALGIVVILDGVGQPASTSASGIGAGLFPIVVGVVMSIVALCLGVQVLRRSHGEPDDAEGDIDVTTFRWKPWLMTIGAILLFIVAVDPVGYIPIATITFWLITMAMGGTHRIRAAIYGLVLAIAVFAVFNYLLRIDLPAGLLEGVL